VQAAIWIASCLADALAYSHARGLVHMDIKPSNVLITMDGQPMLLDFHLARGPIVAGERGAIRIGGTPGWMSPEQEQAMAAIAADRPAPALVDGRSTSSRWACCSERRWALGPNASSGSLPRGSVRR
jgi:serine/threonine protein kinase